MDDDTLGALLKSSDLDMDGVVRLIKLGWFSRVQNNYANWLIYML